MNEVGIVQREQPIGNAAQDLQPLWGSEWRVRGAQAVVQGTGGHKLLPWAKLSDARKDARAGHTMMMPRGWSTIPNTRTMLGEVTPIIIMASFCSAALALLSTLFSCLTATSKPCHLARYTVPKVPLPI